MTLPTYNGNELAALLARWMDRSLDSIHSAGLPIVGVEGCDRRSYGFRAERLAERFLASDVQKVFQDMALAGEPSQTNALLLFCILIRGIPVSDVAQALGFPDDSHAQSALISAKDEFMTRLLSRSQQPSKA